MTHVSDEKTPGLTTNVSVDAVNGELRPLFQVKARKKDCAVWTGYFHALERAGDHGKNMAEVACHLATGHTVRHLLRSKDKPVEQLFIDWLGRQNSAKQEQ